MLHHEDFFSKIGFGIAEHGFCKVWAIDTLPPLDLTMGQINTCVGLRVSPLIWVEPEYLREAFDVGERLETRLTSPDAPCTNE